MPDTTYTAESGTLGAYVAVPHGEGPWPGVVVIQDASIPRPGTAS